MNINSFYRSSRVIALFTVILTCCVPMISHGSVIEYNYTFNGSITNIKYSDQNSPDSILNIGDTFVGTLAFIYDSDVNPSSSHNSCYYYYGSYFSYSLIFNEFIIQMPQNMSDTDEVKIDKSGSFDKLNFYDYNPIVSNAPNYPGLWSDDLWFNIIYNTNEVLNDGNLPNGLYANQTSDMNFYFNLFSDTPYIGSTGVYGRINSLTPVPAPVPEPSTLFLLASGMVYLGGFRKKIIR